MAADRLIIESPLVLKFSQHSLPCWVRFCFVSFLSVGQASTKICIQSETFSWKCSIQYLRYVIYDATTGKLVLLQTLIIIMKIFNLNVGLNTQNTVHGHLLVFHLGSFAKYILFPSPLPPLFIIFPGKQICLIYGMPELKLAIYKGLLIDMVTQLKAVTETSTFSLSLACSSWWDASLDFVGKFFFWGPLVKKNITFL